MKPSALRDALRSTVNYCEAAAETGNTETLEGAMLVMAGYVESDDPEAATLLQTLVEATR